MTLYISCQLGNFTKQYKSKQQIYFESRDITNYIRSNNFKTNILQYQLLLYKQLALKNSQWLKEKLQCKNILLSGLVFKIQNIFNIFSIQLTQSQQNISSAQRMKQTFEDQTETFVFPLLDALNTQKQKFICPNKNQAYIVCKNLQCQAVGFICSKQKCHCINIHNKCSFLAIDEFLKIISKQQIQIPQNFQKSYKTVHKIIDNLICQLSQIQQKLYFQQKYFKLKKQALVFMALIEQHKMDKVCEQISGKIVYELKKALQSKSITFTIDSVEEIEQNFKLKKLEFDSLHSYIKSNYMKYDLTNLLCDSTIVNQTNQKKLMCKWLSQALQQNALISKLLFRASEHNFSATEFHKHCDGYQNTLVIVKNEYDKVIGGFTPKKWQSQGGQINDQTGKSFLFSLTLKEIYKCVDPQNSIQCDKSYGPQFGAGCDLYIVDNANKNESGCNFPCSYNLQGNGIKQYQRSQQTWTLLTGETKGLQFRVKQYEVYQIKAV